MTKPTRRAPGFNLIPLTPPDVREASLSFPSSNLTAYPSLDTRMAVESIAAGETDTRRSSGFKFIAMIPFRLT